MDLKVGDVVEFKKYEDMGVNEIVSVPEGEFPKYGKVAVVTVDNENVLYFSIEGSQYGFSERSVARIICGVDISSLNEGDEVLVKATVKKVFNTFLQIEPSIAKTDVVKILKHEEPECFIVQEYKYALYIGGSGDLVSDKNRAKIYASREDANEEAAYMCLSRWDVIPYDD